MTNGKPTTDPRDSRGDWRVGLSLISFLHIILTSGSIQGIYLHIYYTTKFLVQPLDKPDDPGVGDCEGEQWEEVHEDQEDGVVDGVDDTGVHQAQELPVFSLF